MLKYIKYPNTLTILQVAIEKKHICNVMSTYDIGYNIYVRQYQNSQLRCLKVTYNMCVSICDLICEKGPLLSNHYFKNKILTKFCISSYLLFLKTEL